MAVLGYSCDKDKAPHMQMNPETMEDPFKKKPNFVGEALKGAGVGAMVGAVVPFASPVIGSALGGVVGVWNEKTRTDNKQVTAADKPFKINGALTASALTLTGVIPGGLLAVPVAAVVGGWMGGQAEKKSEEELREHQTSKSIADAKQSAMAAASPNSFVQRYAPQGVHAQGNFQSMIDQQRQAAAAQQQGVGV
jgi:hypothetical protein